MIIYSKEFLDIIKRTGDFNTYNKVFIYQLCNDEVPFYIGSSKNPSSRYLGHYVGNTLNTKDYINEMIKDDKYLKMKIFDLTTEEHRIHIESKWINETPNVINKTKYIDKYEEYLLSPEKYFNINNLIDVVCKITEPKVKKVIKTPIKIFQPIVTQPAIPEPIVKKHNIKLFGIEIVIVSSDLDNAIKLLNKEFKHEKNLRKYSGCLFYR